MKKFASWLFWIFVISCLGAFFLLGFEVLVSCRSAVNLNLRQYQCNTTIENVDGTVDFKDCIKTDGSGDKQDATGGHGDDKLESGVLRGPPNSRLN